MFIFYLILFYPMSFIFNLILFYLITLTCPADLSILLAVVVTSPRVCDTFSANLSSSSVSGYRPRTSSDTDDTDRTTDGGGEIGSDTRDEDTLLTSAEKITFRILVELWINLIGIRLI